MKPEEQQLAFNRAATRALLAVASFATITAIVDVFQSRKLDAVEKHIEALEGRTQEMIADRNKYEHKLAQDERALNECDINFHECNKHLDRKEEIVQICVDKAIQRLGERRGTAMP